MSDEAFEEFLNLLAAISTTVGVIGIFVMILVPFVFMLLPDILDTIADCKDIIKRRFKRFK